MPRILLVHDFIEARRVYEGYLESAGFSLLAADDVATAVDLALQHHPDAILIDDNLPDMSWWEAAQMLKQHPNMRRIPMILLSGLLSQSRRAAEELGVEGMIVKPCSEEDLVNEVKRVLSSSVR